MTDSPVTGALSYAELRVESIYGTDAAGTDMAFGHDLTTEPARRNNLIRSLGLGSRNTVTLVPGTFEGTLTANFILANTRWMGAAFGASSSAAAGSAYDHTYAEANAMPSFTVEEGTNLTTTDHVSKFLGCKINTMTLKCAVGEPVRVTLDMPYKTETEGSTLDGTPSTEAEDPLHFAHGSLQLPSGSTLAQVHGVDFTLNNNLIRSYGLGSRLQQALIEGERQYTVNIRKAFMVASDILEKFYGAVTGPSATDVAETATLVLTFTNGLTAADERTLVITGTGVKFDEESLPKDPKEEIIENATCWIRTCGAVGTDATQTTIFDA